MNNYFTVPLIVYVRGIRAVNSRVSDGVGQTYELIIAEDQDSQKETWLRVSLPDDRADLLKRRIGCDLAIELIVPTKGEVPGDPEKWDE